MTTPPAAFTESPAFPRRSVIILSMVLTTLGFTLTSLFPYVGIMAKHLLGLSTTNESGYYAGFIASSFTLGRFFTAYFWGYAADVIGRKPVVIIGLLAIATCSVAFGLSDSFAMAITTRFVLGLMNGIMPAVRTMTREICGPEHVVLGMTYVGGSKGIGIVIGTAVGGLLAMPASNFPNVFSATGVFAKYPFLLPNVFGACLALFMLPLVLFYLPETRTFTDAGAQLVPLREVSPDVGADGSAAGGHRPKPIGRRLAYQPLEDHEESEKMKQHHQYQPQPPNSAEFAPAGRMNRAPESRRAGSRTAGAVELVSISRREKSRPSRYELLEENNDDGDDDDDDDDHDNDNDNDEWAADMEVDLEVDLGGDSNDPCLARPRDRGGGSDANGDTRDEEMASPVQTGEGDPGIFGAGGLLSTPNVKLVISIAAIVQMAAIGFDEAYPLWAVSTVDVGGLGWTPEHIGKVLAASGVLLAIIQLGVAPSVIKRVGMVAWQRAGCLLSIAVFLAFPSAKRLSWNEGSLFVVSVLGSTLTIIGISSNMLALTVASTSIVPQAQRGKLGGLFMTAESLGRFLGPASFSSTFAWSISTSAPGWIDYHFVFYLSAAIIAAVLALGWRTFTLEALTKPADRSAGRSAGGSAAVGDDNDATDDRPATQVFASSPVAEAEPSVAVDSPRDRRHGDDALGEVI